MAQCSIWLTPGSSGNRVTAPKDRNESTGAALCDQIRDGGLNLVPGDESCRRKQAAPALREVMHDRPASPDRDVDGEFKRLFLPCGLVAADCDDWLDGFVVAVRAGRGQCPSADDGVSKMDRV